uniref:Uncharacterized protein n=1 Tax=Chromera velia CCMP2878 TaxID=1169474 RepID=A0A0G4HH16_9ALVE|eukprot:Cvel_27518.t1-p1 / transcript=Cvel_27518.t1 / gene=Cvel_27518 / organism=Chromera_velia_CCMP2878 / gene_product=hypothetical protein / transcript_product=hypothetical protein / location=Cvel_scaffold3448:429-14209(-) / protein_length=2613 / sequence_SO=supercontig / SO=protein_coding / is_pseudo=false
MSFHIGGQVRGFSRTGDMLRHPTPALGSPVDPSGSRREKDRDPLSQSRVSMKGSLSFRVGEEPDRSKSRRSSTASSPNRRKSQVTRSIMENYPILPEFTLDFRDLETKAADSPLKIQKSWRGFRERRRHDSFRGEMTTAILTIQKHVRSWLWKRKQYEALREYLAETDELHLLLSAEEMWTIRSLQTLKKALKKWIRRYRAMRTIRLAATTLEEGQLMMLEGKERSSSRPRSADPSPMPSPSEQRPRSAGASSSQGRRQKGKGLPESLETDLQGFGAKSAGKSESSWNSSRPESSSTPSQGGPAEKTSGELSVGEGRTKKDQKGKGRDKRGGEKQRRQLPRSESSRVLLDPPSRPSPSRPSSPAESASGAVKVIRRGRTQTDISSERAKKNAKVLQEEARKAEAAERKKLEEQEESKRVYFFWKDADKVSIMIAQVYAEIDRRKRKKHEGSRSRGTTAKETGSTKSPPISARSPRPGRRGLLKEKDSPALGLLPPSPRHPMGTAQDYPGGLAASSPNHSTSPLLSPSTGGAGSPTANGGVFTDPQTTGAAEAAAALIARAEWNIRLEEADYFAVRMGDPDQLPKRSGKLGQVAANQQALVVRRSRDRSRSFPFACWRGVFHCFVDSPPLEVKESLSKIRRRICIPSNAHRLAFLLSCPPLEASLSWQSFDAQNTFGSPAIRSRLHGVSKVITALGSKNKVNQYRRTLVFKEPARITVEPKETGLMRTVMQKLKTSTSEQHEREAVGVAGAELVTLPNFEEPFKSYRSCEWLNRKLGYFQCSSEAFAVELLLRLLKEQETERSKEHQRVHARNVSNGRMPIVFVMGAQLREVAAVVSIQSAWRAHRTRTALSVSVGRALLVRRAIICIQTFWKWSCMKRRLRMLTVCRDYMSQLQQSRTLCIESTLLGALKKIYSSRRFGLHVPERHCIFQWSTSMQCVRPLQPGPSLSAVARRNSGWGAEDGISSDELEGDGHDQPGGSSPSSPASPRTQRLSFQSFQGEERVIPLWLLREVRIPPLREKEGSPKGERERERDIERMKQGIGALLTEGTSETLASVYLPTFEGDMRDCVTHPQKPHDGVNIPAVVYLEDTKGAVLVTQAEKEKREPRVYPTGMKVVMHALKFGSVPAARAAALALFFASWDMKTETFVALHPPELLTQPWMPPHLLDLWETHRIGPFSEEHGRTRVKKKFCDGCGQFVPARLFFAPDSRAQEQAAQTDEEWGEEDEEDFEGEKDPTDPLYSFWKLSSVHHKANVQGLLGRVHKGRDKNWMGRRTLKFSLKDPAPSILSVPDRLNRLKGGRRHAALAMKAFNAIAPSGIDQAAQEGGAMTRDDVAVVLNRKCKHLPIQEDEGPATLGGAGKGITVTKKSKKQGVRFAKQVAKANRKLFTRPEKDVNSRVHGHELLGISAPVTTDRAVSSRRMAELHKSEKQLRGVPEKISDETQVPSVGGQLAQMYGPVYDLDGSFVSALRARRRERKPFDVIGGGLSHGRKTAEVVSNKRKAWSEGLVSNVLSSPAVSEWIGQQGGTEGETGITDARQRAHAVATPSSYPPSSPQPDGGESQAGGRLTGSSGGSRPSTVPGGVGARPVALLDLHHRVSIGSEGHSHSMEDSLAPVAEDREASEARASRRVEAELVATGSFGARPYTVTSVPAATGLDASCRTAERSRVASRAGRDSRLTGSNEELVELARRTLGFNATKGVRNAVTPAGMTGAGSRPGTQGGTKRVYFFDTSSSDVFGGRESAAPAGGEGEVPVESSLALNFRPKSGLASLIGQMELEMQKEEVDLMRRKELMELVAALRGSLGFYRHSWERQVIGFFSAWAFHQQQQEMAEAREAAELARLEQEETGRTRLLANRHMRAERMLDQQVRIEAKQKVKRAVNDEISELLQEEHWKAQIDWEARRHRLRTLRASKGGTRKGLITLRGGVGFHVSPQYPQRKNEKRTLSPLKHDVDKTDTVEFRRHSAPASTVSLAPSATPRRQKSKGVTFALESSQHSEASAKPQEAPSDTRSALPSEASVVDVRAVTSEDRTGAMLRRKSVDSAGVGGAAHSSEVLASQRSLPSLEDSALGRPEESHERMQENAEELEDILLRPLEDQQVSVREKFHTQFVCATGTLEKRGRKLENLVASLQRRQRVGRAHDTARQEKRAGAIKAQNRREKIMRRGALEKEAYRNWLDTQRSITEMAERERLKLEKAERLGDREIKKLLRRMEEQLNRNKGALFTPDTIRRREEVVVAFEESLKAFEDVTSGARARFLDQRGNDTARRNPSPDTVPQTGRGTGVSPAPPGEAVAIAASVTPEEMVRTASAFCQTSPESLQHTQESTVPASRGPIVIPTGPAAQPDQATSDPLASPSTEKPEENPAGGLSSPPPGDANEMEEGAEPLEPPEGLSRIVQTGIGGQRPIFPPSAEGGRTKAPASSLHNTMYGAGRFRGSDHADAAEEGMEMDVEAGGEEGGPQRPSIVPPLPLFHLHTETRRLPVVLDPNEPEAGMPAALVCPAALPASQMPNFPAGFTARRSLPQQSTRSDRGPQRPPGEPRPPGVPMSVRARLGGGAHGGGLRYGRSSSFLRNGNSTWQCGGLLVTRTIVHGRGNFEGGEGYTDEGDLESGELET